MGRLVLYRTDFDNKFFNEFILEPLGFQSEDFYKINTVLLRVESCEAMQDLDDNE